MAVCSELPFIVAQDVLPPPTLNQVGGKALNLWRLSNEYTCNVPQWICITTAAFQHFIEANKLQNLLRVDPQRIEDSCRLIEKALLSSPIPTVMEDDILSRISAAPLVGHFLAVRSSGTDEDSGSQSFAGQFESFLFQKGSEAVLEAVRKCWVSCFSPRVMAHRLECGLATTDVKMAVIIQVMVSSESSGVAFSRHPLKPISGDCVFIESVFGLGEGLVGGALEGDRYEVSRTDFKVTKEIVTKEEMMVQSEVGGVQTVAVVEGYEKEPSLSDGTAVELAKLLLEIEKKIGSPQDFEWAVEKGVLYCLQTRPIVTLPPSCFYGNATTGGRAVLWDNSNIVESYSGVTSPLTFSFASRAYTQVYTTTLRVCQVPAEVVESYQPYISNMVGLVRGNVYYNLMNWYRYVSCMPVGDSNKFMETMMGVKQTLEPDLEAELGKIQETAPKFGVVTKAKVYLKVLHTTFFIDSLVEGFFAGFNKHYQDAVQRDFKKMSLTEQVDFMEHLFKDVLGHWDVPILNDAYVMLFFGLLKKMVRKYLVQGDDNKADSLQNDLLCGQGNVESTEPTKMLMRIAEYVDKHSAELRAWFVEGKQDVVDMLAEEVEVSRARREGFAEPPPPPTLGADGLRQRRKGAGAASKTTPPDRDDTPPSDREDTPPSDCEDTPLHERGRTGGRAVLWQEKRNVVQALQLFLSRYGFRCPNEQKLEGNTLHDDPAFLQEMVKGYILSKAYSIKDMESKELQIKTAAEALVAEKLSFHQRILFNWVLFHARRGVRHRENLRFARTKLFGVFRNLFRGIGHNLAKLKQLDHQQDVFYLTLDEISAYVEGRAVTTNLKALVEIRRKEYNGYRKGLPPPERFLTRGACGVTFEFPQILEDLNLLKDIELEASSDPNMLRGIPCCPGVVEGVVRVVNSVEEAEGLSGEILVTARTDPGWVPLYPLCSGLIIERGSLLSHSAVVARELGLPTIVSVSGGLMKRLKTGMKVTMDAGKGTITLGTKE